MNLNFRKYLTLKNVVIFISWFIPFFFALKTVILGEVPFWYDPARDLLLAIDNLAKPTLIGAPSGIPGVFYGPYWIWIQSLGLLVSKNPRIVELLVLTIPYFIFFPLLLYKLTIQWGWKVFVTLWLLFILSYNGYTVQLWSPNLAPLLFLALIYLISTPFKKYELLKPFLAGFIAGSFFSFHISIGFGVIGGTLLFFFAQMAYALWRRDLGKGLKYFYSFILSLLGVILSMGPFIAFEVRHGFFQTKALFSGFSGSLSIQYEGLSKYDIIRSFFERGLSFLHLNTNIAVIVLCALIALFLIKSRFSKLSFLEKEKYILLLLFTISLSILAIYLKSKNPVWSYHFLTTEVIFIILLGFLLSRLRWVKNIVLVIVLIFLFNSTFNFVKTFKYPNYDFPNLNTKEHVADLIVKDAGGSTFSVFAHNPAIFSYDYDYIFRYEQGIEKINKLNNDSSKIYLIVPTKENEKDFIEYKTPSESFKTQRRWEIPDGEIILKRELKNE